MIRILLKITAGTLAVVLLLGIGYLGLNRFTRTGARQKTFIAVAGTALAASSTQTESPVDTNTWAPYNDQTYDFSIKYPKNWQKGAKDPEHPTSIFTLTGPDTNTGVDIAIRILPFASFSALEEKLKSQQSLVKNKILSTVNNTTALVMSLGNTNSSSLYIYFQKDGKLLNIIFYKVATMDTLGSNEKGILSTFQLNSQSSTPSVSTTLQQGENLHR